MFGFYSEKQLAIAGSVFYSNAKGEKIEVTEVSTTNFSHWDDAVYLGEVTEFLESGRPRPIFDYLGIGRKLAKKTLDSPN